MLAFLRYPRGSGSLLLWACCSVESLIGPHVLGVFPVHHPVADFFADLGKLLLMFFAGLEIDLALFRRARTRSIIFGLMTTSIPLATGRGGRTMVRIPDSRCHRVGITIGVAHAAGA